MFAGWKVALGVGLAAAIGLGVQEIRLRGLQTQAETLKGAVAGRHRDVKEAVDSAQSESEYRRFLSRAIDLEAGKVERLLARNAALGRALVKAKKDALDVPTAPGCEDADDSWRAFIGAVRLQRLAPRSVVEASRGEPGGAAGDAGAQGIPRHLQAPAR